MNQIAHRRLINGTLDVPHALRKFVLTPLLLKMTGNSLTTVEVIRKDVGLNAVSASMTALIELYENALL